MSIAIRIDKELYNQAKKTAEAECRTVPLQITYWAQIGRAALDNPDIPVEMIRDIIAARKQGITESFEFRDEE